MTGLAPRDLTTESLDSLAALFVEARRTGTRLAPPASESMLDLDAAYSVQRRFADQHCAGGTRERAGWKVSATGTPVQARLRITEPIIGTLFSDEVHRAPAIVPTAALCGPVVNATVAFLVRDDLPELCSRERVLDSVDVAPALELAQSRYLGWPERQVGYSVQDLVLDNAFGGLLFLGEAVPAATVRLGEVAAMVTLDQRVLTLTRRAVALADPIASVGWLARTLHRLGGHLTAGTLVTSTVLGGPVVSAGTLRVDLGAVGSLAVNLLPSTGPGPAQPAGGADA